jgi:hypothetical protein
MNTIGDCGVGSATRINGVLTGVTLVLSTDAARQTSRSIGSAAPATPLQPWADDLE